MITLPQEYRQVAIDIIKSQNVKKISFDDPQGSVFEDERKSTHFGWMPALEQDGNGAGCDLTWH